MRNGLDCLRRIRSIGPLRPIAPAPATGIRFALRSRPQRAGPCLHSVALCVVSVSASAQPRKLDGDASAAPPQRPFSPAAVSRQMRHRRIECAGAHAAVLRVGDDTDTTQRATTLRPHPLAALALGASLSLAHARWRPLVALAVRRFGFLLPSRHVSSPGLVGLRSAGAVPSACPVVAAVRLALSRPHRLGALLPASTSRAASLSRRSPVWPAPAYRLKALKSSQPNRNHDPTMLNVATQR